MTFHFENTTRAKWLAQGTMIGLAGGLAEVLVVGAYSSLGGIDAAGIARAIADAARIDPGSAAAGLVVHMALSALLGIALLAAVRRGSASPGGKPALRTYATGGLALGLVWLLNFFIVLPIVSPGFVHLLPYAVTLASKLMFGVSAVATLRTMSGGRLASNTSRAHRRRAIA